MGKTNDENVKTGQQETNEPWKKPDRSDHHPDKDSSNRGLDVPRTTTRPDMPGKEAFETLVKAR